MSNMPFYHLFRTLNENYVYDVNTNTVLNVNNELFDDLTKLDKGEVDTSNHIEVMKAKGYLSSNRAKKIEHPVAPVYESYLNSKMNTVTLQVTQQCNLRCHYCAYSGNYDNRVHENRDMELETALKAIDLVIDNSSDSPKIDIGFYGGEPLLKFELIKKCVKYAKTIAEGKKIVFRMTTNGTLLSGDRAEFLVENDFNLLISIDGPKEHHDKNRIFINSDLGSYDVIMNNIEELTRKYPEYVSRNIAFNAVLDGETEFKCAHEFFSSYDTIKDFSVNFSFVSGDYTTKEIPYDDIFDIQYKYERFKVYLNKLGKLSLGKTLKIFQDEFINTKDQIADRKKFEQIFNVEHPGGPCVPCIRKMFVSVDGTIYPCERVSELSVPMQLGHVKDGVIDIAKAILSIGKITEKQCINCWAYRYCIQCAAGADDLESLSPTIRLSKCDGIKRTVENEFKTFCSLKELGFDYYSLEIERIK